MNDIVFAYLLNNIFMDYDNFDEMLSKVEQLKMEYLTANMEVH